MSSAKSFDAPIEAVWMRGGSSKGLFVRADDLPRDYDDRVKLLARLIGSPDPLGQQIDGLGGATPGTSKVVVLSRSKRFRHDIDFWFGQVDVVTGLIDSRGSCDQLTAAVGPAAIWLKLIEPQSERAALRIWQVNLGQTIESRFALCNGAPVEAGTFKDDGVPYPSAEIELAVFAPEGDAQESDDEDDDIKPIKRSSSARRLMQGVVIPA